MVRRLCIFFLLQFLHGTTGALQRGDQGDVEDFSRRCPPQRCTGGGPEIRYPFRLESALPSCGSSGLVLSCSDNRTILPLRSLPPNLTLSVVSINYSIGILTIKLDDPSYSRCPLQDTSLLDFSTSSYYPYFTREFSIVNCSQKASFASDGSEENTALISCPGSGDGSIYAVDSFTYMDIMPPYCVVVLNNGWIPNSYVYAVKMFDLASLIDVFIQERKIYLEWGMRDGTMEQCMDCEVSGGRCVFSQARNQTLCFRTEHRRSNTALIVGISVGGASAIVMALALFFFIINKKFDSEEEMRLKIENFLSTYQNMQPARYTYSEIKKITMRFKQKLGQGGFGTVYKGELPNGVPVAVKMIAISHNEGDEFINEVATIGRIRHVNVVRLLGFCSEGSRRGLIYEFMPNGSLEKSIFSSTDRRLDLEKLLEIAIGIAQGIEYLHQGCDQRILHFDIKPHNVLLDHGFVPKISDFGLAKLCARDQCSISMTAARGTMGYMAPEIYSRNFGNVSYKSDVYSFGMLLLEMVGGGRNADPSVEDRSAVYFPEWVYERLVRGEDLVPAATAEAGDGEEIAKKLVVVGLWCIQWSPPHRPDMARVVQMLLGEAQALDIPPKPFASSSE